MISALLLSIALAGSPADSMPAARASSDDPAVQLWINNDRRFLPGDDAKVQVRTRDDGYLLVLHVDTEGHLRVLFPLDPKDDDFVRGGRKYEVRGRAGRESFSADSHSGRGTVYAAVSSDPYKFDGYVLGDHWDYRALAPNRLASDPEAELNDLVRRMSQDDFDYDLLTYDVIDRVAYSDYSGYSTPYYSSTYFDTCFSCGYRSGLSIGLVFGRPFRRAYYDPFFPAYDPYYDPFFYDPYYYPTYYSPFYYYPRAYRPVFYAPYPHYYGFYNTPGRRFIAPNTPYRFRGNSSALTGFRGRGFTDVRSVNTVYVPPRSRVVQPKAESPARRMSADPHAVPAPAGAPVARRNGKPVVDRPAAPARQREPAATGRQPTSRAAESRRHEAMPQDVSPRREAAPEEATPRDVTPRRADVDRPRDVDRPQVERAPVEDRAPAAAPRERAPEARPAPREEPSRAAPSEERSPRSSGGSGGGGGDRGGSAGGRSVSPASPAWGGGGGGGGSGGGGRRR